MKVLVTGASGFFGKTLVPALLEASYEVVTFGRSGPVEHFAKLQVEHRRGDILDAACLPDALRGIDVLIHMAGLVSYRRCDLAKLQQANVLGTQTVMQAALEAGIKRAIHMSSIAGMGIAPDGQLGSEDIVYNLAGRGLHYCDSKHASEAAALDFYQRGLPVLSLNPGITFGHGDTHPHHKAIFTSMQRGGSIGYPTGGVMFCDIQDVVRTTINAIVMGRPGQRYVVGSANLTFRQAATILARVIGGRQPVLPVPGWLSEGAGMLSEAILPSLGEVPRLTWQLAWLSQHRIFFSWEKARQELNHKPTDFEQTIKGTAAYYLAGC